MLIEIDKRFTAREIYDIGVGHGKTLVRNVYAAMLYYLKGFAETVADKLSSERKAKQFTNPASIDLPKCSP